MAAAISVIQNACHTPTASKKWLKRKAAGIISTVYRSREITREGLPIPKPSRAPLEMTDTEETINPTLIMRKAMLPAAIVSGLVENNPINWPGISNRAPSPPP